MKDKYLIKLSVLIVVLMVAVLIRAPAFAKNNSASPNTNGSQVDDYLTDTAVTAKVKARILEDKQFSVSSLNVVTEQRKVTVSGFVTSVGEVSKIRRAVLRTHGVKGFINKLRVRKSSHSSLRLYASDVATTSEALTRLFAASDIDAHQIHVATRHSEVFLTGSVPSQEQKQKVETVVKAISGVHQVKNELLIKPQH